MSNEESLRLLCESVGEAQQALDQARAVRDRGIAEAADAMRMRDLVRVTGLTREHVRRIIRDTDTNE